MSYQFHNVIHLRVDSGVVRLEATPFYLAINNGINYCGQFHRTHKTVYLFFSEYPELRNIYDGLGWDPELSNKIAKQYNKQQTTKETEQWTSQNQSWDTPSSV